MVVGLICKPQHQVRCRTPVSIAEAVIRNALNLEEINERRKTEIALEEAARISADMELQQEAEELSQTSIQHSLNLHAESEHRREAVREVKEALASETEAREKHDEDLRIRLSAIDEKLNRDKSSDIEADSELQQRLNDEEFARRSDDTAQQLQTDADAEANIQAVLSLKNEADRRREGFRETHRTLSEETQPSLPHRREVNTPAQVKISVFPVQAFFPDAGIIAFFLRNTD